MSSKRSLSKNPEKTDSDSTASKTLVSAWIGVIGVLVGALFGFSGSLLLYLQGINTQDTAEQNRIADVRREAYSEFVAQSQSVRGAFTVLHNEIVNGSRGKALFELHQNTIAPEIVKYARASSSIELVAPIEVSSASHAIGEARDRFSNLAFRAVSYTANPATPAGLPYPPAEFNSALANFDKAVREFVAAAKASAL